MAASRESPPIWTKASALSALRWGLSPRSPRRWRRDDPLRKEKIVQELKQSCPGLTNNAAGILARSASLCVTRVAAPFKNTEADFMTHALTTKMPSKSTTSRVRKLHGWSHSRCRCLGTPFLETFRPAMTNLHHSTKQCRWLISTWSTAVATDLSRLDNTGTWDVNLNLLTCWLLADISPATSTSRESSKVGSMSSGGSPISQTHLGLDGTRLPLGPHGHHTSPFASRGARGDWLAKPYCAFRLVAESLHHGWQIPSAPIAGATTELRSICSSFSDDTLRQQIVRQPILADRPSRAGAPERNSAVWSIPTQNPQGLWLVITLTCHSSPIATSRDVLPLGELHLPRKPTCVHLWPMPLWLSPPLDVMWQTTTGTLEKDSVPAMRSCTGFTWTCTRVFLSASRRPGYAGSDSSTACIATSIFVARSRAIAMTAFGSTGTCGSCCKEGSRWIAWVGSPVCSFVSSGVLFCCCSCVARGALVDWPFWMVKEVRRCQHLVSVVVDFWLLLLLLV